MNSINVIIRVIILLVIHVVLKIDKIEFYILRFTVTEA